jgi:tetraacyldisaccharide 4'-kinase
MHSKFPEITIAVDADRKNGIEKLLSLPQKPNVILLDDAFQHRRVKAGFYIVLTAFDDLFCDDLMLPTGMLREPRFGAKRADMIIVTKCPKDITELAIKKINERMMRFLVPRNDKVYNETTTQNVSEIKNTEKVLLAGIAKPKPFFDYLQSGKDEQLNYPDHHHFIDSDVQIITKKAANKVLITTEKDYVRLKHHAIRFLFYLPIKSNFISNSQTSQDQFDKNILHYVGTSSGNR